MIMIEARLELSWKRNERSEQDDTKASLIPKTESDVAMVCSIFIIAMPGICLEYALILCPPRIPNQHHLQKLRYNAQNILINQSLQVSW